jgi:hypothetical protein
MRRKRYKSGHIAFLTLEASTLDFKDLRASDTVLTSGRRLKPSGVRDNALRSPYYVGAFARCNGSGVINFSYTFTIDKKELLVKPLTIKKAIVNYKKTIEACISNWSTSINVLLVDGAEVNERVRFWAMLSTVPNTTFAENYVYGAAIKQIIKHYCRNKDSNVIFDSYLGVNYVITKCLLEYPRYVLEGKIE